MKLLKIFREHVKMNLVHKKKFWSYLGFSAGGGNFTPPPYEIGLRYQHNSTKKILVD